MPARRLTPAVLLVCVLGATLTPVFARQSDADQLLLRAVAEQTSGDTQAAIRDYRALLMERPASIEAHVNLGAALAHTSQFDAAIEQYRDALADLGRAGAADPALTSNLKLNLALAYYKKGDLKSARDQLQPLYDARPGDARLATLLGDTDTRLGDPAAAIAIMRPLAAVNEQNLDFNFAYGSALIRDGRKDERREGVAIVAKVAELGHSADAYMLAGSTLLDLNEYERARFNVEQALLLDPKLPGIYSLVGVARDRTGASAEAEPAFREALKQNPNDFSANLYLGAILTKQRHLEEAKVYLDKALLLDSTSTMARYEGALLKSTAGDSQAAVAELEKVTAANPEWLEPHVQLASLYYRLHKPEQGAKERAIVDKITAAQQASGPGK